MTGEKMFDPLKDYLLKMPAVTKGIGSGVFENGGWWVKFAIDIAHPLAWNLVQEMGHVLNYLSLNERLPTAFKPVSPPPYMNGGPANFLSWVIECVDRDFTPTTCLEWLDGRLPRPVDDLTQWKSEDS